MMPDATMAKMVMKSIFAFVSTSQHRQSHSSKMHTNRIISPCFIFLVSFIKLQSYAIFSQLPRQLTFFFGPEKAIVDLAVDFGVTLCE